MWCSNMGGRLDRPVQAYQRWLDRLPAVYATAVLNHPPEGAQVTPADDPHCLAQLRHSRA